MELTISGRTWTYSPDMVLERGARNTDIHTVLGGTRVIQHTGVKEAPRVVCNGGEQGVILVSDAAAIQAMYDNESEATVLFPRLGLGGADLWGLRCAVLTPPQFTSYRPLGSESAPFAARMRQVVGYNFTLTVLGTLGTVAP